MKRLALIALAFFAASCCRSIDSLTDERYRVAPAPSSYAPRAAAYSVDETVETFHDAKRNRDVPVRIYLPHGATSPMPIVVFSHGIGEDRDSYAWLGRALASHGYVSVHVTHAGTDRAMLKSGYLNLYRATKKKENWVNRPHDVSFVLDQLASRRELDMTRVAVAGHSAGAFTALAMAGMRPADSSGELADRRVKVAIAMSMPKLGDAMPDSGFDFIATPVLHMTGTCDGSLIYRTNPRDRRIPFLATHATNEYLVTFKGVNHNVFSNVTDEHHGDIADVTLAFLDAWLRGDNAAREWLDAGGLASRRGVAVERK
jgi:predicted dienelactone hydrolase